MQPAKSKEMLLSWRPNRLRVSPLRLIAVAAATYACIWVSSFPRDYYYYDDEIPSESQRRKHAESDGPKEIDAEQLVVTVRSSASDAYAKLVPVVFWTDPTHYDSLVLVGDLHMDIGAFHVHDVLDRLDMELIETSPDLVRYDQQRKLFRTIDISTIKEQDPAKEAEVARKMDKYKYLRMIERAWELKPDRSWYAFIDADSYIIRSNLMAWLHPYDANEATFFANAPDFESADPYGTSGRTFILSGQAMRKLLVDRQDVVGSWERRVPDFSTGFDVLTAVLATELSLSLNSTWPGLSGYDPTTVPYGPGMWCEPVLAMDSVSPKIASEMWRLQRDHEEHNAREPLTFAELWNRFLQPQDMADPRDDWDNLSSGPSNARWNILLEGVGVKDDNTHQHRLENKGRAMSGEESWEGCRDSCNNNSLCVQFSYSSIPTSNYNENPDTKCHLSRSMRLGSHVEARVSEGQGDGVTIKWKSGWRKDHFDTWSQRQRCRS